ncbi:MAG TPA: hypothetical protein VL049_30385 [Candidatus Dormibacteraeota bacterium]|nr:hypothetical protein [Candidatus Dormibacteraeota bacterium]
MALAAWLLLAAASGCDSGGDGSSPFRNLGKRGDSALPASAPRPAPR